MVVMELLRTKGLVPELPNGVQDIVFGMGTELRDAAMRVASSIRSGGRSADLVLEDKRMKWVFKHAERVGAERLVMVMPEEWSKGNVKVKNLSTGEESEVPLESL
jgi:histidyl-tRNA synthetase